MGDLHVPRCRPSVKNRHLNNIDVVSRAVFNSEGSAYLSKTGSNLPGDGKEFNLN